MDDDNDDWFGGGDDAAAPEPEAPKTTAAGGGGEKAAAEGEARGEDAEGAGPPEEELQEPEEAEYLDPDKFLLFKHWIRPKYLQYKYIYDYRRNYYDDVIEVIERRRKGFRREIPRPQTWAERVMRTYSNPVHKVETFNRFLEDVKLVTRSEISGAVYKRHAIESVNKRYAFSCR